MMFWNKLSQEQRRRLRDVVSEAEALGFKPYLVGGIVRDILLGRPSWDLDIVTEGDPGPLVERLAAKWAGKITKHPAFLTYVVAVSHKEHLDFATAREESYPEPAKLPVVQPSTMETDLGRRDFSINAMALPIRAPSGLLDPHRGQLDLKKKIIRALHSKSFQDDPTRIYRAARYAARFGFRVEPETRSWILASVKENVPARLSRERLREELLAVLAEKEKAKAFGLLKEWGALRFWHPDLAWKPVAARGERSLVSLGLLLLNWKEEKAEEFLESLRLAIAERTALMEAVRLFQTPEPETLTPLTRDILKAAWGKKASALFKRMEAKPLLSGQDLRALGFPPGPFLGQALDALRKAQWSGRVKTKAQAKEFVVDRLRPS